MKKATAIILSALILICFAACGGKDKNQTPSQGSTTPTATTKENTTAEQNGTQNKTDYDSIPDEINSSDGRYEIAFVTDVGQLKDKSFNQGTWEGVKGYAFNHDKTYKYYQPANGDKATDEDRYDAMKSAVSAGAKIVFSTGFLQGSSLKKIAMEYPDVKFVFIDGEVLKDDKDKPLSNVAAVDFNEEQSGFLAGYAAVMEGFDELGFSGGGGGSNPPCCRFGYGFVQGAEAAAKQKDENVKINFSWEYGSSFSASPELQTMLNGWYANGTEVIFVSGGAMCLSAFQAASENDAYVIGVDIDQSTQSDTVITSATKDLRESVDIILEKYYQDKWDEVGGKQTTLGVKQDAVGLPTENWKMESFTLEDYRAVYDSLKKGEIKVDRDYEKNLKQESFDRVELKMK